jgi:hypothetical protein
MWFNDDLEVRYWRVPEQLPDFPDLRVLDYVEQVNRLNAGFVAGRWSFNLQVDEVALLANRYVLDGQIVIERELTVDGLPSIFPPNSDIYLNPEKLKLTYETKAATASLGDSYVAFGRGIGLNLNRNVEIDIDTSIQGAKVELRPGAWEITMVGGQANRQQVSQDNPNSGIYGDLRHAIAGVRAERFGLGPANIGAHGVYYNFVDQTGWEGGFDELGDPPDALVGGLTTELVGIAGIDGYVEGDLFSYGEDQPPDEAEDDVGYGLYGSASGYPGPFVVLIEGKRYDQAERVNAQLGTEQYEVAVAPTLEYERVITKNSEATLNSQDVTGGRVQIDWAVVPGILIPSLTFAAFRDRDLTASTHFNTTPETILHPVAGVEWIDGEIALLANAGYRWDLQDGGGMDRQPHADLTFNFPLPGEFAGYVSLQAEQMLWADDPESVSPHFDFVEVESSATLTYERTVSVSGFLDSSNDPQVTVAEPGNVSETLYAGVELQVEPASAWTIKAFYGAQKAGIRCAGGQCRLLPGFDGARVSVVGTF